MSPWIYVLWFLLYCAGAGLTELVIERLGWNERFWWMEDFCGFFIGLLSWLAFVVLTVFFVLKGDGRRLLHGTERSYWRK